MKSIHNNGFDATYRGHEQLPFRFNLVGRRYAYYKHACRYVEDRLRVFLNESFFTIKVISMWRR